MSESPGTARVRIGTSSFSTKDWVGPFYPPGTQPRDYLLEYARHFDCVEVDASYYAVPAASTVRGWDEKTPEGFLLAAKFPRSIVHAGQGSRPDPTRILLPDACYQERDAFLRVMEPLGDKLGPLLLQFPYFNRAAFSHKGPFLERLQRFLSDLPGGFQYAVEVRNRTWLDAELAEICREHGAGLTIVDQAWMPHGDEVEGRFDFITAPYVYVRLLGDHREMDALTTTWDKEVVDRGERLLRWAAFTARAVRQNIPVLIFINNHYAGHAPATARRLEELLAEGLGAAPPSLG